MFVRRAFLFAAVLFLSVAIPASAHDLPMGGSRWSFGDDFILGFIDLKSLVLSEIRPIKEGHYDFASASEAQLPQLAIEVIQPYINKRLAIAVNGRTYPVKVDKIERNGTLYTICLSVHNVSFSQPQNEIRITYSLLFEETGNEHVNLAFGYLTDATGTALQRVFNMSPPEFQTTFDAQSTVWQIPVKGVAIASATEQQTESLSPVAKKSSEGMKPPVAQKNIAGNPAPAVSMPARASQKPKPEAAPVVRMNPSLPQAEVKETRPLAAGPVKWRVWATFRQFVPLGIEHILTGYDHIAFLLGIIVIELSIREILKIITAFTIAHSVTLLLAALEIVRLNSRLVESVIAFSICYVALENIFRKKVHYRWLITFGFGLVHGFGFASALKELIIGKSNLLLSVVSFNMGVETGQLMLFFVMLPILYLLKKQIGYRLVTVGASAGVFVTGFAWLIERVFRLKLLWF
jgi:hydrogenase/urease accessory protein HupE